MKQKLVFDAADANTIAASDSIGAYLRASDGTLLTHTDVGGRKALDVRVAEGINVEVDLDHADDSVKIGDGTDFLAVNADGSINITDNGGSITVDGSVTVSATDLDIRDLTSASDSVRADLADGAGTALTSTLVGADQALDVNLVQSVALAVTDNGGSLTVDATQLDIDDLNATDDAVQAWTFDGTGNAIGSTTGALNVFVTGSGPLTVNDASLANTAIATASNDLAVADTAEDVVASPLSNRKYLYVYNNDNREMYIGATGVTAATGFPLFPGAMLELRAGASIDIEWVSAKLNHNIRTLELS